MTIMKYLFLALGIGLIATQGLLFYFADCSTVKDYFWFVQTPAKCITINQN